MKERLTDDAIIARMREIEPNMTKVSEENIRNELKVGSYGYFSMRFTKSDGQVSVSPVTIRNMTSLEEIQKYVEMNSGAGEEGIWVFPSIVKRMESLEEVTHYVAVKEGLKNFWEESLKEEIDLRQKERKKK